MEHAMKKLLQKGGELIINYQLEYYEKNLISNLFLCFKYIHES